MLREVFGKRPANKMIKKEIVNWLTTEAEMRKWAPATRNRWQATLSFVFHVGIDNERIAKNPAALIRRNTENNDRVRYLTDFEEAALVKTIQERLPEFLPHLYLAIWRSTGMRMSEQYSLSGTRSISSGGSSSSERRETVIRASSR